MKSEKWKMENEIKKFGQSNKKKEASTFARDQERKSENDKQSENERWRGALYRMARQSGPPELGNAELHHANAGFTGAQEVPLWKLHKGKTSKSRTLTERDVNRKTVPADSQRPARAGEAQGQQPVFEVKFVYCLASDYVLQVGLHSELRSYAKECLIGAWIDFTD